MMKVKGLLPKRHPAQLAEHGVRAPDYGEPISSNSNVCASTSCARYILYHAACRRPRTLPFISNLSLSLGVLLRDPVSDEKRFARVKVPKNRPRWVSLDNPLHFVPLEQIMIHNLDALFPSMDVLAAYPFRVTRNADIARNEEEADDLLEMINEELREQRFAAVVRLEIDANMPDDMLGLLRNELGLEMDDIYPVRGPLRLADLFMLADINLPTSSTSRRRLRLPPCRS